MDLWRYREVSELKLIQNNRWKCQWWISGNEMPKVEARQLQGGGRCQPERASRPPKSTYVFGYVIPKSMTRLRTFQDIQPRRYDIQRDALSQRSKKGPCLQSPPIAARKMTRKCCAVDPPASVCAVRAYLRCNRSVDENFLPGIRGTVNATALGSA